MIMAHTPPMSPTGLDRPARPASAMMRSTPRSQSRMSMMGGKSTSRTSDEDSSKTTVQVAVRVRPPLKSTDPGFDLIPQRFQKSMVHVTSPTGLTIDSPQGRRPFVFDRVFGEEVQQAGIWDYISSSVDSFVQGYNVSVMAYGQSGAGKSFTMGTSGPSEQDDANLRGIIPRAASALFAKLAPTTAPNLVKSHSGLRNPNRYSMSSVPMLTAQKSRTAEKSWQVKATYVEIYNEQLRDLLLPDSTPMGERQTVSIREDTKGRILLTGLHQVNIDSAEDLLEALNLGSMIRQTDATAINARSSRSHAVFSLNLVQRKTKLETMTAKEKRMSMPADAFTETITVESKLHFVDLAGSERLKNTQAIGERAKEGISINAGLASLGKVISQLSSRNAGAHVSYRDSKLTRLLQDSLGGNAITYLIACVTPPEFHLSETLNTVQYAQRARAIQTKPQILQVEDGDKQAIIDRLRAEIQFLRDQIRSAEDSGKAEPQARQQRSNERELDLQDRLLDLEESYSTLSQRHARLMSEMTKDREENGDDMALPNGTNDNAIERIKRSTSFADAVEQVVLEYEKTIQSLETSLSKTRSTLSINESALLEQETRVAYIETMNQQLQTRISRMINRETKQEQYIHDMESRLDGVVGGEERQSAMLTELRKEIARLRDFETTSEDYISGLEGKLAEANNNSELLHREVTRLEDILERQRNVGRIDNLLQDLDQGLVKPNGVKALVNGRVSVPENSEQLSDHELFDIALRTPIPADDAADYLEAPPLGKKRSQQYLQPVQPETPEQSHYLQEKLEVVNQELFDLRVEHESTISDYDLLSAKYEEALRTLAALQDSVEESQRTNPSTLHFLSDEGANEGQRDGKHSSSRSLSLELSSLGQSTEVTDPTELGSFHRELSSPNPEDTSKEIERASNVDQIKLLSRQSAEYSALQQRYEALHDQHLDTLDLVEELKTEVQKVRHSQQSSPTNKKIIRRKSTQNMLSADRAHRSLAALQNILADNLADNPDIKDNFEINLNNITHELHQRSERVHELENELANIKKELDTKMTIITGLARERSSMAAATSPVEMSMMSAMQSQIIELERQLSSMHQNSSAREQELTQEINALRTNLDNSTSIPTPALEMPGTLPETPMEAQRSLGAPENSRIPELGSQIAHWQEKHQVAVTSMQESEKNLLKTVSSLEQTLAQVEANQESKMLELESLIHSNSAAAAAFDLEREKHEETIQHLKKEIQQRATTIGAQASRLVTLEKNLTQALSAIQENETIGAATSKSLDEHRTHIETLQKQLTEHQVIISNHQDELTTMQERYESQLESKHDLMQGDSDVKIAGLTARHAEQTGQLHQIIEELQQSIRDREAEIAKHERSVNEGSSTIENLRMESKSHSGNASEAIDEAKTIASKLRLAEEARDRAETNLNSAQARVEELQWAKEELNSELQQVRQKEQRASRLVEELESQLNNTFEDSRNTSSRLSHLQSSRDQELMDARAALIKTTEEATTLRTRLEQLEASRGRGSPSADSPNDRANSLNGQFRKPNVISLPSSPPPNAPLPPIPMSPGFNNRQSGSTSPRNSGQSVQQIEERDARIRTMEKHLKAEKQLTQTLEEALSDLEAQVSKSKAEQDSWQARAGQLQSELDTLKQERAQHRQSMQQIEEEAARRRREADMAKRKLEENMAALQHKKKKKSGLNCF